MGDRVNHERLGSIIIGAGLMGLHHARAAAAAGASIVGIVDRDLQATNSLRASYPSAVVGETLEDVAKATRAEVAHICTPADSHVKVANAVATAGMHGLIEKPLATSAADAKLIHARFGQSGRRACPTHQYAFQRCVRAAQAKLPRLGVLRHIAFDICSAGAAGGQMAPDELVAEILPHPLSIVQRFLPSTDIAVLDWACARSANGEWLVAASASETLITMSISASGRPTRFRSSITGDKGTIEIDHFHDFAVFLHGNVSRTHKIVAPFIRSGLELATATGNLVARAARREFAYPGLNTLIGEFYASVRDPLGAPPITPEQSVAVAEARDQIIGLASRA